MTLRSYAVAVPAAATSLRALRAFFGAVLEAESCAEAEQVVLALDEACANLIKHRQPSIDDGAIRVVAQVESDRLRFRIGGFCRRQDVAGIKPRQLDDVRPGGLGTSFISQIMDSVSYEPDPQSAGAMALVLEHLHAGGRCCGGGDGA